MDGSTDRHSVLVATIRVMSVQLQVTYVRDARRYRKVKRKIDKEIATEDSQVGLRTALSLVLLTSLASWQALSGALIIS